MSDTIEGALLSFCENVEVYANGDTFVDFEWFAVDDQDCVAVFASGTQLAVPEIVLAHQNDYLTVCRAILSLEPIGESAPPQPGLWMDFGARGLYGFDVPYPCRSPSIYGREFSPTRALTLGDLRGDCVESFEKFRMSGLKFADVSRVDAALFWSCK